MAMETYFFDEQLAKYIVQFMAIFRGLKYQTGKREDGDTKVLDVPIVYGSRDRVTASILADHTQNKALRLPLMSVNLNEIALSPERRKGVGVVRRATYLPRGGMFPDDITTTRQIVPIPYDLTMEVVLFTSNMNQHRQVIEQILMYFDPLIQIQKTDEIFDWTKITQVELTNISFDENYPAGPDQRTIVSTLTFAVPIYISAPTDLKSEWVKNIYLRMSMAETSDDLSEVLALLDGDVIEPTLLATTELMDSVQIGETCDEEIVVVESDPDANC